jgi:cbb3-type cytochrome oxidase subunit 1
MSASFIKVSVIYFVIGASLGIYMGIMNQFSLMSAHAHINLLGWVSLALAGVVYRVFPLAGENRLAKVHFWLHVSGIPFLCISMILFGLGKHAIAGPLSGVGGILVLAGVIFFAANVLKNVTVKG